MGGGIGAFYITGFAAYQLLHVIATYVAALSFIIAVTGLAFGLALADAPTLSLIGTIGGFAAPAILYTDQRGGGL